MKTKKTKAASLTSLRKKAEAKLRKQDAKVDKLSARNVRGLAHELGTYQIELEMQNEELRNAQEELEASRSKYVDLYDFAPVGYFTLDEDGRILEVNLAGADMLGVNRRILLKKPFSSFIPERGDKALFHAYHKNILLTQTRQTCELRLTRKKNPPFIAQLISSPSETIDGEAGVFRTAVIDITGRRQAEEELTKYREHLEKLVDVRTKELQAANESLRTADEKLRSVLDNSRDVIYRVNALTGHYEYISPSSVDLVGFSPDELMTQKNKIDLDMVYPDDLPAMRAALAHLEETDQADLEYRQRTKSGDYRWISDHVRLIRDGAGRPLYRDGTMRDITESKRAEEERERLLAEVQRNAVELDAVFRALPYQVSVHGKDGRYVRANPALVKLFGFDPTAATREEIARGVKAHFPDGRPLTPDNMPSSRALKGEAVYGVEYQITKEQGETHDLLMNAIPLQADGHVYGAVFAQMDITELKRAEEALRRLNRTLQALTHSGRAILRATGEAAYLQEICRIIVEDCGYAMVWVGFAEQDEARSVRPAASAGFEAGYLDTLQLTWADTERGRGPTGTAIRTGQVAMCRNMQTDPQFAPWRAEAIKRGYASSAVFPLLADGRAFGALTVYSREPEGFGDDEARLLTELAGDFAYGITTLRLRAAHAAAEVALRDSEERYRSLFENMMHGFAHCKMLYNEGGRPSDFIYLDVNSAFTKMTGLQNVAGKRVTEVIPGIRETHPELFDIYGRVALTGQPEKFEIEFKPLELWLAVSVYSTVKEHFVAIFDDITERKKAEMALFESQERYRSIVETASEGIWIGDFEGRTTFVNESVTKMIGYDPEEVIGKTALDFMDEDARAIARFNLEQRRHGHKNSYELKFIRKDGSTLWAIVGATPLRDKNGNIVASMAMITDITERKLVEEKTLHQQAVLTSINRIFREALTTDSEEELGRACLSIAEELTGSKCGFIGEIGPDGLLHDTAISDPGWDLCTMKDKTGHRKPLGVFKVHGLFGRVITDERPFFTNDPYSHHDSIGTPEGHPRLTAFLGVPLIHRGKTIGLLALANRVGGYRTEDVETMEPLATVIVQALMRKRTESSLQTAHTELKQRAYELEAVNRELEAFSYTVSHDLKTPLRSIDGFTRALLEDYGDKLDSTARDYLVRVNSAALRMNQLIQAMLDMARLTRRELIEQGVDLSALAQVIAENMRKQDPARMVEFVIADKIIVRGDTMLLQAVLENLMHNAWKFTAKHKTARIEFGVTVMYGHPVYFVKDDGAGFDMQFAEKLFMPFNRFHTESEFAGLGIGLATANRIILRHNGRFWAESAPEKGATFYFTLPLRNDESDTQSPIEGAK